MLAQKICAPFKTLDPDDSIALNPNEIPVITFRKRRQVRLGPPYGICRPRRPSGLTHFEIYTKKHCFFQCLNWDLNISFWESSGTMRHTVRPQTLCRIIYESQGNEIIQWKDWQNWSRMQLYIEFTPCQSKPRKAAEGMYFCETICMRIKIC